MAKKTTEKTLEPEIECALGKLAKTYPLYFPPGMLAIVRRDLLKMLPRYRPVAIENLRKQSRRSQREARELQRWIDGDRDTYPE